MEAGLICLIPVISTFAHDHARLCRLPECRQRMRGAARMLEQRGIRLQLQAEGIRPRSAAARTVAPPAGVGSSSSLRCGYPGDQHAQDCGGHRNPTEDRQQLPVLPPGLSLSAEVASLPPQRGRIIPFSCLGSVSPSWPEKSHMSLNLHTTSYIFSRLIGVSNDNAPPRAVAPIPEASMLQAALMSAFSAWPQATHLNTAYDVRFFLSMCPQALQACDV